MKLEFGTVVTVRNTLYKLNQPTVARLYREYGKCLSTTDIQKLQENQECDDDAFGVAITQDDLEVVNHTENTVIITEKNSVFGYMGFALSQWGLCNKTIKETEYIGIRHIKEVGKEFEEYIFRGEFYIVGASKAYELINGFHKKAKDIK